MGSVSIGLVLFTSITSPFVLSFVYIQCVHNRIGPFHMHRVPIGLVLCTFVVTILDWYFLQAFCHHCSCPLYMHCVPNMIDPSYTNCVPIGLVLSTFVVSLLHWSLLSPFVLSFVYANTIGLLYMHHVSMHEGFVFSTCIAYS